MAPETCATIFNFVSLVVHRLGSWLRQYNILWMEMIVNRCYHIVK